MASSPCDYWTHLSDSLAHSSSSSSSLSQSQSQTPSSSSIEYVWNDIKLASLFNSPADLDFNNHNNSSSNSSFLTLTSSTSNSVFHKHNHHHSLLSVSNASFHASPTITNTNTNTNTNKTTQHKDQRHMRIIKNRESAVRSRSRKQAYRKGLEVEIARLTEENSRIKRQLKELQCCLSSSPTMAAPCRTSSSPF